MRISDWSSDVCSSDLWKPARVYGPIPLCPNKKSSAHKYVDEESSMAKPDLSRRRFMKTAVVAGIIAYIAPFGSTAYAALFDEKRLTPISLDRSEESREGNEGVSTVR